MIGSEEIKSEGQVKLVGVLIDNKLSYDEYISTCLKNTSAIELNETTQQFYIKTSKESIRLLLRLITLQILFDSLALWKYKQHSTEKLHERVIRFIHSDYETDYFTLLKNLG